MSHLDEHKLSSTIVDKNGMTLEKNLAWTIATAADEKKADDIVLLQVGEVSYLTDYFVIVTGFSKAQVRAIADTVEAKVELEWHQQPLRVEGKTDGNWILMDYGDVIVHILLPTEREYYNLEAFWGHAERIEFHSASERAQI